MKKYWLILMGSWFYFSLNGSYPAQGYSPYLDEVRFRYQHDYSCNICHHKQGLTTFGKDFKKYFVIDKDLRKAFLKLECDDSDGDGWSNRQELLMGYYPNDRLSHPDPATIKHEECLIRSH